MRLPQLPSLSPPPAKRVFDLLAATALLAVLALPLLAVAAALHVTRLDGAFLREPALGLTGRPYRTWRLRTAPGGHLARLRLDRLPQLINVLRGEMSLVGPCPEARTDHPERLLVRPGMTGLWQVSTRSGLPWDDKDLLDRHYVEQHWLGMDLAVLARTPRAALRPPLTRPGGGEDGGEGGLSDTDHRVRGYSAAV
ncbi:sugar transferase [Streptomyces sp. NPDC048603]|uniref:sugar transferase n=1 Tax=Streptomyces sp. NPDC048603 TaxID=3365577 RepID=UPI003722606B